MKSLLSIIAVALISLPMFLTLTPGIYLILGLVFGGLVLMIKEYLVRKEFGKGSIDTGFELAKAQAEDSTLRHHMETSEDRIKFMTAIIMFVYSMGSYLLFWPGMMVLDLVSYTVNTLKT